MRSIIGAFATAACTAALTLAPAATAHATEAGCVYRDSAAVLAADPSVQVSFTFPEGSVNPEGQICHGGVWVGDSIDDGSYDDMGG